MQRPRARGICLRLPVSWPGGAWCGISAPKGARVRTGGSLECIEAAAATSVGTVSTVSTKIRIPSPNQHEDALGPHTFIGRAAQDASQHRRAGCRGGNELGDRLHGLWSVANTLQSGLHKAAAQAGSVSRVRCFGTASSRS